MRSNELDLTVYNSDKIESNYLRKYDPIFKDFLDQPVKLLEIGIYKGGSLLLWKDYFPHATIVGIDIKLPEINEENGNNDLHHPRISMFKGSQTDAKFLSEVAGQTAPDGYDIIIDDASHYGEFTKTSFWHLFDNHLKPGGIYVIEDWGTGYWSSWSDGKNLDLNKYRKDNSLFTRIRNNTFLLKVAGKLKFKYRLKSHDYGMVGFIKQLIDELAAEDVYRFNSDSFRKSKIESILCQTSLVFIKKA